MSDSTDKLALLTECIESVPDDIKRRVKNVKITWVEIGDTQFDGVVCPNVEIELYPITGSSFTAPFNVDKPL